MSVGGALLQVMYDYLLYLKAKGLAFSFLKVPLAAISCYHKGIEEE